MKAWRWIPWSNLDLALISTFLLIVGGVWAFLETMFSVQSGRTREFDEHLIRSLRHPNDLSDPIGPIWFQEMARDITALGSGTALALVTGSVAGYLLLVRKTHALGVLLTATIGAAILSYLLKDYFARPRPELVSHLAHVTSASFPSGHAMLSATVYLTLGTLLARLAEPWRLKFYFVAIATFLTFIIGVSRIYLGVHWPTDVLAGWSAGLTWALLCGLVARSLQRQGAMETTAS
ncbi:MAG: phosphatase PAP2 family protein [Gemmataceae bacterium]